MRLERPARQVEEQLFLKAMTMFMHLADSMSLSLHTRSIVSWELTFRRGVFNDPDLGPVLYYHYVDTTVGYADDQKLFGWNAIDFSSGWPVV